MTMVQLHMLTNDGRYTDAQSAPVDPSEYYGFRDVRGFARRAMHDDPTFRGYAIMTPERAAKMKGGRLPKPRGIAANPRRPQGSRRWPTWPKMGGKTTSSARVPGVAAVAQRAKATGSVSIFPPGASANSDAALCELARLLGFPVPDGRPDAALIVLRTEYRVRVVDPDDWSDLHDRDRLPAVDPAPWRGHMAAETFHQHA